MLRCMGIMVMPVFSMVMMPMLMLLAMLAAWFSTSSGTSFFGWTNASNSFRILQQRHMKVTIALKWIGNLQLKFMLLIGWRRNSAGAHRITRTNIGFQQKHHGGCCRAANTASTKRKPSLHRLKRACSSTETTVPRGGNSTVVFSTRSRRKLECNIEENFLLRIAQPAFPDRLTEVKRKR